MLKEMTCIMCPAGCELEVDTAGGGIIVTGNRCPKGYDYAVQEITNPLRNIATSVLVKGGSLPLVSVRLNQPIEKSRIFAVMDAIKTVTLTAPVHIGDVVLKNAAGTGSDVIATKNIEKS